LWREGYCAAGAEGLQAREDHGALMLGERALEAAGELSQEGREALLHAALLSALLSALESLADTLAVPRALEPFDVLLHLVADVEHLDPSGCDLHQALQIF